MEQQNQIVEIKEKKKCKYSIFEIILAAIFGTLALFIITVQVWGACNRFTKYDANLLGNRIVAVASDSMSYVDESNKERLDGITDQIQVGDLITISNYKSFDEVQVNDVVGFFNGESLVIHRVTRVLARQDGNFLITQGDASKYDDGMIKFDSVRGKVTSNSGQIGTIPLYLFSSAGLFISYIFIVLGAISWILVVVWKNQNQREIDRLLAEGIDPFTNEVAESKAAIKHKNKKQSFRDIFSGELEQIDKFYKNK